MLLAIHIGRKYAIERMPQHIVDEHIFRFFQTKPHIINRIFIAIAECLTIAEGRCFQMRKSRKFNGFDRSEIAYIFG